MLMLNTSAAKCWFFFGVSYGVPALFMEIRHKCYQALVRGKVETLRSRELEIGDAARAKARDNARRYFTLACRYARLGSPAIVAICGLSGTGKSATAEMLQCRTGFLIINSDRVRKQLAGMFPVSTSETERRG